MTPFIKKSCSHTVMPLLIVIICLFGSGVAEGKELKISLHDSTLDIKAREVPLAEILKTISARTGLSLKLDKPLMEAVSFDFKDVSIEEALKRMLASHNYALTYRKTADDQFFPEELRVMGVGDSNQDFLTEPQKTIAPTGPPPEDPYHKKFDKVWFGQRFGIADRLSGQIAATPYTEASTARGILITSLSPESELKKIGLKVGDVIRDVNGNMVNSAQEFLQILSSFQGGQRMMRISRMSDNKTEPIYISLY